MPVSYDVSDSSYRFVTRPASRRPTAVACNISHRFAARIQMARPIDDQEKNTSMARTEKHIFQKGRNLHRH